MQRDSLPSDSSTPCGSACTQDTGSVHGSAGFTLVELVISIAIIALLTAVVLARYGSFNSSVLLNSLAYDIALSVREAQVLGISVRGEGGAFAGAYGVHFTEGTSYLLFLDENGSDDYDSGEEITTYTIGQGNSITELCADSACALTTLDVLFERPEPDARFSTDPPIGNFDSVRVIVESPEGESRTVRVWPTGQIAVE